MLPRRHRPRISCVVAPGEARSPKGAVRVVAALVDLETGGTQDGPALECKSDERRNIARRLEPEDTGRAARWERAEPVQDHVERRCANCDGRHQIDGDSSTFVFDLAEEVQSQMECFRTRPANLHHALAKLVMQPLRFLESRLGHRYRKEAPHPAGEAVGLALGLGLAGGGVGAGDVHGLPPALVSVTSIAFALHNELTCVNSASTNQTGLSVTLYGVPA
jgi:hypothetical protein